MRRSRFQRFLWGSKKICLLGIVCLVSERFPNLPGTKMAVTHGATREMPHLRENHGNGLRYTVRIVWKLTP
jgi:hypothetical protein